MITIFCAMYPEARPVIKHFHLKKDMFETAFQRFRLIKKDRGTKAPVACLPDISLVVTGMGPVNAASAVSYIFAKYPPSKDDIVINLGCCAEIIDKERHSSGISKVFLVNRISDLETGRDLYPDIVFKHSFPESSIVSGPVLYTGAGFLSENDSRNTVLSRSMLYDQEAFGLFEAAKRFVSADRIIILKIPIDNGIENKAAATVLFAKNYIIPDTLFDFVLKLENPDFSSPFSRIYQEDEAKDSELAGFVRNRFPDSQIVDIRHYKDIFSRPYQASRIEKAYQSLVLAKKKDNFVYEGSENCQGFGADCVYYVLTAMNCPMDCSYCFLKGMYPGSDIVLFTNIDDCFSEMDYLIEKHKGKRILFSLSYETDLPAIDCITGYIEKWLSYAATHLDAEIEIRTKTNGNAFVKALSDISASVGITADANTPQNPPKNLIAAFTVSPDEIISRYESKTASLAERIKGINSCIYAGFFVRLCFDPVILDKSMDFKDVYGRFLEKITAEIDLSCIKDISVGSFRMPEDYLKNIRKQICPIDEKGQTVASKASDIFDYPFEKINGTYCYSSSDSEMICTFMKERLSDHISGEKLFFDRSL